MTTTSHTIPWNCKEIDENDRWIFVAYSNNDSILQQDCANEADVVNVDDLAIERMRNPVDNIMIEEVGFCEHDVVFEKIHESDLIVGVWGCIIAIMKMCNDHDIHGLT